MRKLALLPLLSIVLAVPTVGFSTVNQSGTPVLAGMHAATVALMLQDAPSQPGRHIEVEVDVNRGGGAWYTNPVWIAIGALSLLVLIILIVMAARGRTTVVR
jgi:hypothetical protein